MNQRDAHRHALALAAALLRHTEFRTTADGDRLDSESADHERVQLARHAIADSLERRAGFGCDWDPDA